MIEGIIDNYKAIGYITKNGQYMSDENGKLIISKKQAGEFIRRYRQRIKDGEIPRYSMHFQISNLDCYKGFDEHINKNRKEIVEKLNNKYYRRKKYIKIKQCMD